MKFHAEQLKILKDLILEYKKESNERFFLLILQRVDRMLVEIINKISRIYYFNDSNPQILQDMYQTAIIGLRNSIISFSPDKKESSIPIWIFLHVRNEIFKIYGVRKFNIPRYLYTHPDCIEKSNIDSGLIQEDIRKIIEDLITSKKITKEEIQLINLTCIEEKSISDILRTFGDRWGSRIRIVETIERVSRILKRKFEEKGFESD